MKGWRKPKAFAAAYSAQKRFLAFVLTLAMIFTSVGTDLNVSYAAQGNKVDFEIYGSDLVNAINEAVESDNVVKPDSLEFTNGAIDKFETLFYGEGKVYEVYPQIDGGDLDAELRVFVRLPEDADDMYMVTGDEEVIFLYVNNGDETISCATRIIRSVDGEEKVKTTKRINVKSYEDKFGDEEVDIVSKKDETVEETTAAEEKSQETVNDTASEETTPAEEKETEITDETAEATEKETTEAAEENTEAETEEATEAEKETEAETEKETAEEKADAEGEVTASLSRHYAPVVAMKEDAQAEPEKETAEAAEIEKEVVETEKETTEAVEKETAEAVETEKETTEAETKDAEVTETETEAAAETSETEETAEDASKEETEAAKETVAETSKAAETTAEAKKEENKKAEAATDSDLVGIGYCSTAKAYTTTVKALKALDDIQGLKVIYAINPEYSARIVDGPRGVEEGDALVFGVKNQIGYAIESVTANGELLEADSTSDNEDGSVTAWYTVPEVTEEQEIEVYMTETDEHPAVELAPIMVDDVIINISADEGVLPEGVTATATRVNEDVENAVADKAAEDGTDVASVMAFDINLWLGDKLLDSEIWGGNQRVCVTFSGEPIEQNSAQADAVDVLYVETVQDSSKEEKEKVANEEIEVTAADIVSVQNVADTVDVSDGSSVDEISFDTEHFSIFAVVGSWKQEKAIVVKKGETVQLTSNKDNTTYSWEITSGSQYVQIQSDKNEKQITVKAIRYDEDKSKNIVNSKAVITCTYANGTKATFTVVTVKNSGTQDAYFFIRKPGVLNENAVDDVSAWYSTGTINNAAVKGALVDMNSPEGWQSGKNTEERTTRDWQSHIVAFPSVYPKIVDTDGKTEYTYSENGEDGTYSVEWMYIVDSCGAVYNNPVAGYNSVTIVGDRTPTYHVDGYAILHKETRPQVNFKVKAVDNTWSTVSGYQVNKNTLESRLVQPTIKDGTPGDREVQKTIWSNGVRYDFDGWYREDTFENKVDFANSTEKIATPTTYYGRYVKADSVKVTYSVDYNAPEIEPSTYPDKITSAYVPVDENDYFVDKTITVKEPIVKEVVSDSVNGGYWTLDNVWKWAFDGNIKTAGSKITVDNANKDKLQFTATWTFHKTADIYYVAVGKGTVTPSREVVEKMGAAVGSKAKPNDNYVFEGWYTDPGCHNKIAGAGMEYTPSVPSTGWPESTTYYAKFEPKKDVSYTVHYYENGTTNKVADDKKVNNQTFDATVEETAKVITGYTVVGNNKQTVTLDAYNKEITFNYVPKTDVRYTVYYKVQDTQQNLGESPVPRTNKTFNGNYTETAPAFSGYELVNKDQQTQNIKLDDYGKSITFWYKESAVVALHYTVADDSTDMGDVSRNGEDVLPVSGKPNGSTANAKDGYNFVNWTTADGTVVSTNAKLDLRNPEINKYAKNNGVYVENTFYAHFQQKIVIQVENVEETYKGSPIKAADGIGWTKTAGTLKDGDRLVVTLTNGDGITDVRRDGQGNVIGVPNEVASVRVMRGTTDVTSEYAFGTHIPGTIKVNPRSVTLTSGNYDGVYDGQYHKNETVTVTGDGFVAGQGVTCTGFQGVRDANGNGIDNTFKYAANAGTNLNNYTINTVPGTLKVSPVATEIHVYATSDSKVYDGTDLVRNTYTVSDEQKNKLTANGDELQVFISGSITNTFDGKDAQGNETNSVPNHITSCKAVNSSGKNVTANYNIITHDGTLTINPRLVTVTSGGGSKEYDGKPLTNSTVTAVGAETYANKPFAEGEGLAYTVTGKQTDVGESDNTFSYDKANDETDLRNYQITKEIGKLEVTKKTSKTITITAASGTHEYDGKEFTKKEYTYTSDVLVPGDELTAEVSGSQTNVNSDTDKDNNTVTSYKVMRGTQDVTDWYTIEVAPGTLTVTPRPVTIKSDSASRPYNGEELSAKTVAVVSEKGFVEGSIDDVLNINTDKMPGVTDVTAVPVVNDGYTYEFKNQDLAKNYAITTLNGTLEITKPETLVAITVVDAEREYDGTPLTSDKVTWTGLTEGYTVKVKTNGSQTTVGENDKNNVTEYHVYNTNNQDVTANYNFAEIVPGKLTVTARPITITAASGSKEYDGTALTANSYTVSENGLADSDEISAITIDGSQIEIGTSSNAVRAGSVKITKKAEAANSRSTAEDVTGNYNIKLEEGILEVTNRNDLSYIVNYHYLDAKGKEVDVESVIKDNAFIGEAIAYSDAASRDHAGKTYALVRVDNAGKAVEYYADGAENPNVVDVYYGLDEIGTNTEKPKTPDGIPDMYQVVFRYISENPSYGTVDGAAVVDGYVMEVVTRPQKADGSYDMDAEVYPLGNVTVTGIGNYTFNHWSDSDTNYANANEIAGHGFKSDMTFVAHFSYDGGNNNNNNGGGNGGNGGGNGGSGSTSGGGSSSSGSRGAITVTSGGPGDQTVTIDAGDVPLAELPDAPVSPVEIDDGEVPLAALPKTGQTTMKLTITLMFSGIFLALTAMSKKHKEEES